MLLPGYRVFVRTVAHGSHWLTVIDLVVSARVAESCPPVPVRKISAGADNRTIVFPFLEKELNPVAARRAILPSLCNKILASPLYTPV